MYQVVHNHCHTLENAFQHLELPTAKVPQQALGQGQTAAHECRMMHTPASPPHSHQTPKPQPHPGDAPSSTLPSHPSPRSSGNTQLYQADNSRVLLHKAAFEAGVTRWRSLQGKPSGNETWKSHFCKGITNHEWWGSCRHWNKLKLMQKYPKATCWLHASSPKSETITWTYFQKQ